MDKTIFPAAVRIEVRDRDVDAMGHVNNAVFFTYLEIARTAYYDQVFKDFQHHVPDFIMASVSCDYLGQVRRGTVLDVGVRISRVGRTSFDFEYEIRLEGKPDAVARGKSTQVRYDYAGKTKMEITPEWLACVERAQGPV